MSVIGIISEPLSTKTGEMLISPVSWEANQAFISDETYLLHLKAVLVTMQYLADKTPPRKLETNMRHSLAFEFLYQSYDEAIASPRYTEYKKFADSVCACGKILGTIESDIYLIPIVAWHPVNGTARIVSRYCMNKAMGF